MLYLASPYSHPKSVIREVRYLAAMQACAFLFREGTCVYSPIVHWHRVAQHYQLPTDAGPWEKQNIGILERSAELGLLLIDGWEESKGMRAEFDYARLYRMCINGYQLTDRNLVCVGAAPHAWPSSA